MSRTYRGKDREAFKNRYNRKGHKSRISTKIPSNAKTTKTYKNASRVYCSLSLSKKWLFHSFDAAVEAIKYNYKVRKINGEEYKYERAYYCKSCGGFHLTTMTKEEWSKRDHTKFMSKYYNENNKKK